MNALRLNRHAVATIALGALFAGCGGSQPPIGVGPSLAGVGIPEQGVPAPPAMRSLRFAKSKPLLYVAEYPYLNRIAIYDAKAKAPNPIGTITDDINDPADVCMDADGTIYVTNQPGSNVGWVSEYPFGQTEASTIITDGISSPQFCAIDAKGDLWVSNLGEGVTAYKKGATEPYFTITEGLTYEDGIAVDASGSVYVSNLVGKSVGLGNIQVYDSGTQEPSRTITDGVTYPVGIALDFKGNLYVTNEGRSGYQGNVTEYLSGSSRPNRVITDGLKNPFAVTLDRDSLMYVTEYDVILEFKQGSLTPLKRDITDGIYNAFGTAFYPPLLP